MDATLFSKLGKYIGVAAFMLSTYGMAKAQDAPTTAHMVDSTKVKHKFHIALGISSGTNALVGVDLAFHVAPMLNIRVGYNHLTYNKVGAKPDFNMIGLKVPEGKIAVDADVNLSNASLLLEFAPFKKRRFRLVVGASYAPDMYYSATLRYAGNISLNDMIVSPDEIGTMNVRVTHKSKISPYIGLGFGRVVPRKRVALGLDLGAYYRDSPIVKIDATKLLAGNVNNETPLNNNLKPYKWFPVANLRLAIRLK